MLFRWMRPMHTLSWLMHDGLVGGCAQVATTWTTQLCRQLRRLATTSSTKLCRWQASRLHAGSIHHAIRIAHRARSGQRADRSCRGLQLAAPTLF